MKVAFAVWNGRIAPVFDVSRHVLVLDINAGQIAGREQRIFDVDDPRYKAQTLAEWGVKILVCGAVSHHYTEMLAISAIETIAFIAGGIEDIIAAFLGDRLHHQDYRMPGCQRCCNQISRTGRPVGRRKRCRTASEE